MRNIMNMKNVWKKCRDTGVLAINRGEKEKFLGVKIEAPTEEILGYLQREIITRKIQIHRMY